MRALLSAWLLVLPWSLWAERARTPAEATVYIRVVGELRAEFEDVWERSVEKREVEIGTGSGFVISEYGHIITNFHVISDEEVTRNIAGVDVKIQLDVERIEVVFPPGSPEEGDAGSKFVATVDAVDPELDVAVLSVSGAELPYIPMGDSDAAATGEQVQVLGFPFGNRVEVGKASIPDIVPRVSISNGSVSAKRADEGGRPRYLQTSAKINPGNSGGPMVDREGFALGVVRMKLAEGEGIGFSIPINVVKDFLEAHALDQLLPVRRMRLGPPSVLEGKGVALRLPEGQEDLSPSRLRVDTGRRLEEVALAIDRVASPWSLDQLEQELLHKRSLEVFTVQQGPQATSRDRGGQAFMARARGVGKEGTPALIMEYALVDLGKEKLIARYLGRDEAVAFNASVIRGSLASLEVEPFLTEEIQRPVRVEWTRTPLPSPRAPGVVVPEGWIAAEGAPFPCPGVPPPDSALLTSPVGDFTVSFLVAWWKSGLDPTEAASACSPRGGSLGAGSYASRSDYLGVSYQIEGIFLELGGELLQLELVAPLEKYEFLIKAFRDWVEQNRE